MSSHCVLRLWNLKQARHLPTIIVLKPLVKSHKDLKTFEFWGLVHYCKYDNLLLEEKNDCLEFFLETMPLKLILMFRVTSTHKTFTWSRQVSELWREFLDGLSPIWTRTKLKSRRCETLTDPNLPAEILGYFGREPSLSELGSLEQKVLQQQAGI